MLISYDAECEGRKARADFPGIDRASQIQGKMGSWRLDEQSYPALVWLRDPANKDTANPFLASQAFELFGGRIASIALEMVSDPPEPNAMRAKLLWWDELKDALVDDPNRYAFAKSQFSANRPW